MKKLLIISFDALADTEFEYMAANYKNTAEFAGLADVRLSVDSVFPTNTFPVHVSVATGKPPSVHGVISNTEPQPKRRPRWVCNADAIKSRTIWQAAYSNGLTTAAVLWPCTGGAREIRWNIPEMHTLPTENQVLANIQNGSKMLQAHMALRYSKLMKGLSQPELDEFVAACSAYILKHKKPDLCLVHLTCYDFMCHKFGRDRAKLLDAYESLDRNLGRLLNVAKGYSVIIFSDHAQINIDRQVAPNDILVGLGLMKRCSNELYEISRGCFIECCGGSAFFHNGDISNEELEIVRRAVAGSDGFGRFLTSDEMSESGRASLPFGFCASPGFCYENVANSNKGEHGFPKDYDDYKVFYAISDGQTAKPRISRGGSLLDIAGEAAKILGIKM